MTHTLTPSDDHVEAAGLPRPELEGVAICVGGRMVAWFADAEEAEVWCHDTHFGCWLMHPCSIPDGPAFTPEQLAEARQRGAELYELLTPGQLAD